VVVTEHISFLISIISVCDGIAHAQDRCCIIFILPHLKLLSSSTTSTKSTISKYLHEYWIMSVSISVSINVGVSINAKGGDCWIVGLDSWFSLMSTLEEV
jgi:hypothetical protein